jgi:hypothetical protein
VNGDLARMSVFDMEVEVFSLFEVSLEVRVGLLDYLVSTVG